MLVFSIGKTVFFAIKNDDVLASSASTEVHLSIKSNIKPETGQGKVVFYPEKLFFQELWQNFSEKVGNFFKNFN